MKVLLIILATLALGLEISAQKTLGKRKLSNVKPATQTSTIGTSTVQQANNKTTHVASVPLPTNPSFASQPYILRKIKLPFSSQEKEYYVKKIGHYYILNGDIIVGNDFPKTLSLVKIDEDYRWSNGTIPVVIDKSIYDSLKASHVHAAIAEFNNKTELCLVPRTTENDYVKIVYQPGLDGGSSPIGRQGGQQVILIGGNASKGTIMHELMHSAGFYHEQSRFDRDNHIRIIWKNVQAGFENNFQMEGDERALGNYDLCSIMHYGPTAFGTKNEFDPNVTNFTIQCVQDGRDINCKDCDPSTEIIDFPNRQGFSPTDIMAIDQAYNTISRFPCNTPFPDPRPVQRFTTVNIAASDEAMQAFRHRAEVASKTGYP